jgi:fibronectin-binding autotransporter adhesin
MVVPYPASKFLSAARFVLALGVAMVLLAGPSSAQTTWTSASGGAWSNASNWSLGLPTSLTAAAITAGGTYTVTITSPETALLLLLNSPNATLSISGATLTLTGAAGDTIITAGTVTLNGGNIEGGNAGLVHTVTNGALIQATGGFNTIQGDGNPFAIVNVGTITATGGTLTLGNLGSDSITNTGTVNANVGTISFGSGGTLVNNFLGVAEATNGGTLNFGSTSESVLGLSLGTVTAGSGSTVNLLGGVTESQLAASTIDVAGTFNLKGQVTNTGQTLAAPTGNPYTLDGGTILNGTVNANLNALAFSSGGGTLDNVTAINNFTVPANVNFAANNGTTFNGTSTFGAADTVNVNGSGTALTIASGAMWTGGMSITDNGSGNVTVVNNGTFTHSSAASNVIQGDGNPFTFTNTGIVNGNASTLTIGANSTDSLTNTGSITANGASVVFGAGNSAASNFGGTMSAINGGSLTFGTSGTSIGGTTVGTLTEDSTGTINLQGNLTEAQLFGGAVTAAGTVNLKGQVTNTGQTFAAPSGGGVYTLDGGTILNGTVNANLNALAFSTGGGTLDNVTAINNFTVPANVNFAANNGTTFNGTSTFGGIDTVNVNGSGTALTILSGAVWTGGMSITDNGSGNVTVVNNGTITHTGAGNNVIQGDGNPFTFTNTGIVNGNASTLTIGANSTDSLTNTGSITANGASVVFGAGNSAASNFGGTMAAINGGSLTFGTSGTSIGGTTVGTLTEDSTGTINLQGNLTEAQLSGGAVTAAGTVNLKGQVTNTSSTFAAPSSGFFTLDGGTILNGTLDANLNALAFSTGGGTLDNVTAINNFTVPTNVNFAANNGTTFTGASTFGATDTVNVNGTGTALTIAALASWTGGMSIADNGSGNVTVVNNGTITHTGAGNNVIQGDGNPFTFSNTGMVNGMASTLTLGANATDNIVNTGTVTANGGIVVFGGGGSVANNALGTLTAFNGGSLTFGSNGTSIGGPNVGTLAEDSSSTINIQGNLTEAQLSAGSVTAAGTINLKGQITNTGQTFAAPSGGGVYTLDGGTILNGTVDALSNAFVFSNGGGTLNNVAMINGFSVGGGVNFAATNGTTFTGASTFGPSDTVNVNGSGTALTIALGASWTGGMSITDNGSGNVTVINNGTITRSGAGNNVIQGDGNPFAFGNTGSVSSTSGTLTIGGNATDSLTNTGTIEANASTVTYGGGGSAANNVGGTVEALNGGTLNLGSAGASIAGANVGTVIAVAPGDTVNIQGNVTEAQLAGGLVDAVGTINLKGQVDNTGQSLAAPATGGFYTLAGGTILNGTVDATTNAMVFSSAGGTLDNVAMVNGFSVPAGATFAANNGTSFTGSSTFGTGTTVNVNGSGTALTIAPGAAWTGGMSITDNGSGNVTVTSAGTFSHSTGNNVIQGDGNPFTFDNSGAVTSTSGVLSIGGNSTDTLTNTGTITANGGTVTFGGSGSVTNNSAGTVQALAGGTLTLGSVGTSLAGTSAGTITVSGAGTLNLAGNVSGAQLASATVNASGGTLNIKGQVNETASLLSDPASGLYTLDGGSIVGGTVASGALTFSVGGGTLNGTTMNGAFNAPTGTNFSVKGGTTFTGGTSTFGNVQVNPQSGTGTSLMIASGAEWIGTMSVVANTTNASMVNAGTFLDTSMSDVIDGGGNSGFTFLNSGLVEITGGSLTVGTGSDVTTNGPGGTFEASGAGATITFDTGTSTVQNVASSTLTNGTWMAVGGGTIKFSALTNPIVTNSAIIILNGAGSNIETQTGSGPSYQTVDQTLVTNNGSLQVLGGRSFASGSAGLTNNGTIELGGGTLTAAALTNGSGSTLSGFGTFNPTGGVTIGNGVTVSPGSSGPSDFVSTLSFNSVVLGGGGAYNFDVATASGAAGTDYDTLNVTGIANVTASPGTPFNISIESINPGTTLPGLAAFNTALSYQWTLLAASSVTNFNAADFTVATSSFANGLAGGNFSVSSNGTDIFLNFTPVPEPSTWALFGLGAAAVGLTALRRRRARA